MARRPAFKPADFPGAKSLGINLGAVAEPALRRSKFNAVPTVYNGVRYDSKAEAGRAAELDQWLKLGVIHWWIGQPKFRLGCPENVYVADFLIVNESGPWVEDVKGVETPKFRHDKKLWKRYGPCLLYVLRKGKKEVVCGGLMR